MEWRHRTKGIPLASIGNGRFFNTWVTCNATEVQTGSYAYAQAGDYHEMWDVTTPDFHKRVSNGEIIMSPCIKTQVKVEVVPGNGPTREATTTHLCSGVQRRDQLRAELWPGPSVYQLAKTGGVTHPIYIPPPPLLSAKDMNDFLVEKSTELLAKRGRPDHDLWEALAELDKTVKLLPGMLNSLRKAVPTVKRSQFSKSLAELWLAKRYGIDPLLGDIRGVLSGLEKKVGEIRKTYRTKGFLETNAFEAVTYTGPTDAYTIGASSHHKYSVRCTSIDDVTASLADNIGLSAKGLFTLPWELIRYSFVIDWFTNIGDVLKAVTPDVGIKQLGSCVVAESRQSIVLSHLSDDPVSGWNVTVPSNGLYTSVVVVKRRVKGTPAPRVVVRSDFRFDNFIRVADAVSLLLQKAGR